MYKKPPHRTLPSLKSFAPLDPEHCVHPEGTVIREVDHTRATKGLSPMVLVVRCDRCGMKSPMN